MASVPSEPRPVLGRLDKKGRLIAADPQLQALQQDAGASIGDPLALPQIASVAQLARKLGTSVFRSAIAAASAHDVDLWVRATPEGDDIHLSLEGWTERPVAAPRLAALLSGGAEAETAAERNEWTADEELKIISLSADLARLLGVEVDDVSGQPLTRVIRLEEDEAGEMPLIAALAARRSFSGQRARSRSTEGHVMVLSGEVVTTPDGSFAGFRGVASSDSPPAARDETEQPSGFDLALDEVLRSPIDRIVESAERIVQRADGPLRSDYASYGKDIAAAARHLLSVLTSMSSDQQPRTHSVDLAALAGEAITMLETSADERRTRIEVGGLERLAAKGERRAVLQILVNLLGNAIRYSPEDGLIRITIEQTGAFASVTVEDSGPGVAVADQQRIFERFERAHPEGSGTGLGLAISRRLARSLGGDVVVQSAPGQGARFTLSLLAENAGS